MSQNGKKGWINPFTIFSKMGKKDGLTPLQFLKNEPKMGKKDELTPLHFFKNEPKMGKKDELTPLQFFEK